MKVVQSLNQNALLVMNNKGEEVVALGRGIGFGKKKGDLIDSDGISRIFTVQSTANEKRILETLKSIDNEIYVIAEDVVDLGEKLLDKKLNETFIFTIAKHIQFAIERDREEPIEYSPFEYQLRYLYPDEYKASEEVIKFINEKYHLNMKIQEISFFTLHFVNGMIDSEDFNDILKLSELLNKIISFIDIESGNRLKRDSIDYSRFIVHLRYFLIRTLSKSQEDKKDPRMSELLSITKEMYLEETALLEKLKKKLSSDNQLSFGVDEDLYLLLHLVRILRRKEGRVIGYCR
ncbi:TPA: PRD domain-containing protein [Enterococcus faecalis]|nr:PRD domain-containing protein [Enterococcus faecalis]HAP3008615.1 PRD domain-containing protein [Enterococcus faecalis]